MARANGEGSIYRKGDAYEVAIFVGGRRRTSRAATLPRAKAKLRELERKRDAGHTVEDEGITVAVFLERWLTAAEMTVRPRTHKRYAEYVTVHAVPSIGHRRLVELRPVHLQALYTERLASGASPSTVAHLRAVMRRALTMAERWEYVNKNVARQVDPPNVPRYKIRPLTAEEVRRLLVASADNRFEAAIYIAVLTGLRLGEIFALHWSDVAIGDESVVRVRGSLQRIRGKLTIVEPKTRESVRDVALGRTRSRCPAPAARSAERRAASPWCGVGGQRLDFPERLGPASCWRRRSCPKSGSTIYGTRSRRCSCRGISR